METAMMNELTFKKALKPRSLAIGILCSAITTVAFSEVSVNESYFQIEQNIDRSIVEGFNREVNQNTEVIVYDDIYFWER